jgi:hypothetical protein
MADAMTCAKSPDETMKQFNLRLREACSNKNNPVTNVSIIVTHGEPVVTLFSEVHEVTEEDVKEAADEGEDPLTLGELIPDNEPLIAQVVKVSCASPEEAIKTQRRLETLYERADGGVIELLHATGSRFGFVPLPGAKDPKDPREQVYVEEPVTYVLISYEVGDDDDEQDDSKGEADMETAVRTPVGRS